MADKVLEERVKQEWKRFLTWTATRNTVSWMFRGQACKEWPLIPKVGRSDNHRSGYNLSSEITLLDNFTKSAMIHMQGQHLPSSNLQWMVLAQHHGLPTRLLDWTKSPFVAAFFALQDEDSTHDAAVYAIDIKREVTSDQWNVDPFLIASVARINPTIVSNRIVAQQGIFTIHPHPDTALTPRTGKRFSKYIFPRDLKFQMKTKIVNISVNKHSLFLSLDGLADHLTFMNRILNPRNMHVDWSQIVTDSIEHYQKYENPMAAMDADIKERTIIGDSRGADFHRQVKKQFMDRAKRPESGNH